MKNVLLSLIVWVGALFCGICFGNPVAIPHYVLDAENVLVAVTVKGAVVTGNYHFKWNEEMRKHGQEPYGALWLQLPVPVSNDVKGSDALKSDVVPVVILNGKKYSPDEQSSTWKLQDLPEGIKVVVFDFWIDEPNLGEKVELKIQYHQPVLKNDGADMVYYIPFLPFVPVNEAKNPLNQERLLINFQSFDDVTFSLRTPHESIVQQTPKIISVRPRHKEIIGVERVPAPIEIKL